jgi:hypothetical protein
VQRRSYLAAARPVQCDRPRRGVGRGRGPGFQAVQLQRELELGGHCGAMLPLQPPQHRPCCLSSRVRLPHHVVSEKNPGARGPTSERRQQRGLGSVQRLLPERALPVSTTRVGGARSADSLRSFTLLITATTHAHHCRAHASQSRYQGGRPHGARGAGGAYASPLGLILGSLPC